MTSDPYSPWLNTAPCPAQHTIDYFREVRASVAQVGEAIREAVPMIELAAPTDWRSPAATAYGHWVGDLVQRCRVAAHRTEDTVDTINYYIGVVEMDRSRP
ncbi:MAG: hypothetical protein LBG11_06595 [Bifidobacteriaceae bacterium]|jgi:hypothetical protein|nr:hypothetical protein [Bifidobacteriaceae bacterium]